MLMNYLTCVSGVVKRIIPAVASTNAVIAGMLTLQMFFGMLENFSVSCFVTEDTFLFLTHFSCLCYRSFQNCHKVSYSTVFSRREH